MTKRPNSIFLSLIALNATMSISLTACAQPSPNDCVNISVNVNTKHVVDGIEEFDREKYITIHADLKSGDWDGDNVSPDLRDEFLNEYDVYLGRESGGLASALKYRTFEDPKRPGYVDLEKMAEAGAKSRQAYAKKSEQLGLDRFSERTKNMLIVNQFHPFWADGTKTKTGWAFSQEDTKDAPFGTASGEFAGTFLKENFGTDGESRPRYLEVINEPDWDLIPAKKNGDEETEMAAIKKLAKFHSSVAHEVKRICPDVKVGGFTCAFPNFDYYDFKRWDYRWKQFINLAGDDMDFWSLHLYDFPCKVESDKSVVARWRKGSNIEATLDMLEQYSMMKYDKLKPLIITEYSCSAHEIRFNPWTPYRDWLYVKSANSMLMTFMDHPQSIAMAIPFFTLKSEWGKKEHPSGNPYRSRLMRQQHEKEGETGDKWVYTDFIHFYEMWRDVRGKRLDITANDLDIQTDAYVNGKRIYVIANNLIPKKNVLNINMIEQNGNKIKSIKAKHYHNPTGDAGVIDESVYSKQKAIEIGAEGMVVLEYTYDKPVKLTQTSEEVKYYAEEYYKQVTAGEVNEFNFKNINLDNAKRAILRVSVARDHNVEIHPTIIVNGTEVAVPDNYKGEPQTHRERFYGMLDIPIDAKLLKKDNTIGVKYNSGGGQIASVTMKVFCVK
ncbi:MAG: hypothetical protein SNH01_05565 [Rikenellaceae bacterium]